MQALQVNQQNWVRRVVIIATLFWMMCLPSLVSANEMDILPSPVDIERLDYTPDYGLMTANQYLYVTSTNWADLTHSDDLRYTPRNGLMSSNQHLYVMSVNWADINN